MEDVAPCNEGVLSGGKTKSHLSNLSDGNRSSIAPEVSGITKLIGPENPVVPRVMRGQARSVAKPARFRDSPTVDMNMGPALECQPTKTSPTSAFHHLKKTKSSPISEAVLNNVPKSNVSSDPVVSNAAMVSEGNIPFERYNATGQWSAVEQAQFQQGCVLYGWGNWSLIRDIVTTRDRHQIKSHAQKFARSYPEVKADLCQKYIQLQRRKMRAQKKHDKQVSAIAKKHRATPKRRKNLKPSMETMEQGAGNIVPAESRDAVGNNLNGVHPMKDNRVYPSFILNPNDTAPSSPPAGRSNITLPTADPRVSASNYEAFFKPAIQALGPGDNQLPPVNPMGTGPVVGPTTGPWSDAEHFLFKTGCVQYGWGNWKAISLLLATRTRTQVKSHAQKFLRIYPLEKSRIDREHAKFCRSKFPPLAKKQKCAESISTGDNNIAPKKSAQVDSGQHTNKKLTEESKPRLTSRRAPGWTFIEEKQFEDGCIFHGWGNWRDIASHIFTKNMSQVFAFAQSYNQNDRESLEKEHRLHYQCDDSTVSDKTTQIRHALLGTGEVKAKAGTKEGMHAPQNSTPSKTNIDDYGAATAILSLRELGCK